MNNSHYEFIWSAIGAVGTSAKYFNDILNGQRRFNWVHCGMNFFSGGFMAWLCAKTTVVVAGASVDVAFIVAGMSGVVGFGTSVNMLDKFWDSITSVRKQ